MKRSLLCLIGFFCLFNAFSQHWNNKIWYFGTRAGINFNTNPPTALINSAMSQAEGSATMCDSDGQLLFYSNGVYVWNRNHQQMPNGFGLRGAQSSTQSALILRQPGSTTIYYIFTCPNTSTTVPLSYSIVDMTLNGGLGDVTTKNSALSIPVSEKLTATLKSNGVDYWVLSKQSGNDIFLAYSFTSTGVYQAPVISHVGFSPNILDPIGYMRISPDGSKICAAYHYENISQLYDFDNNTGLVSNPVSLFSTSRIYGVEFSPDNSKLYTMQQFDYVLRQYDLLAGSATAIQNSVVEVAHLGAPLSGSAIILAPDSKIYVSDYEKHYVSVIDKPNLAGAACNFIPQVIQFGAGPNSCYFGLPNNLYYTPPPPNCPTVTYNTNIIRICTNQNYQLASGVIVNTPGTYHDTIRTPAGCDSLIYIVNLTTYSAPDTLNITAHICPGQSYQLPSGPFVSAEGIYLDTIKNNAVTCDSIIYTIQIFIDHVSFHDTTAYICSNHPYHLPSGAVVNTTGTYIDTARSRAYCDSLITTLHLFVDLVTIQNTDVHICFGQTYQLPSGAIVSNQGTYYIDTIRNQANTCDSITITIHLFVQYAITVSSTVYICPGQTYQLPSGTIVSTPGIYRDT